MKKSFDGQWRSLVLIGIALLGFALRLYGLNWDDGNSFHPDERQILFHVTTLGWPKSFAQFLDPANSPLETGNPINLATVPTEAERNGDFSALLKLGSQYQLYNPFSTTTVNGVLTRAPF